MVVILCLDLFAVLVGCEVRELPGEPIGVYRVVGTLEENSCGPTGLPADDPLLFEVEIRDDDGIGVWALPQRPFIQGTIQRTGEFLFRLEDRYTLRPAEQEPETDPEFYLDPEAYREPQECHLSQVELIQGTIAPEGDGRTLDAGVDASIVLIGSDTIDIKPISNTDCLDMLAVAHGTFATLPCRAVYTLEGELSDHK